MRRGTSTSVFYAIADPTRRSLLALLVTGDQTATELAAPFDSTRSAVSQHLGILVDAGLVERIKRGRYQVYRLTPEPLAEVVDWVAQFDAFWESKLEGLGKYLDGVDE